MKHIIKTGLLLIAVLLLNSCSNDNPASEPKENLPEWDKSQTASLCFVSKLNGEALLTKETDEEAIHTQLRTGSFQAILLDRCDVSYSGAPVYNPAVALAKKLNCVPVFARNQWNGSVCEGSGILLPHTLSRQDETEIAPGCYSKTVQAYLTSSRKEPMELTTVSFQSEAQVQKAGSPLLKLIRQGGIIVGTIRKELLPQLETWVKENGTLRLETIESASSYRLFVLGSQRWVVRNSETKPSGSIQYIHLQIERLKK